MRALDKLWARVDDNMYATTTEPERYHYNRAMKDVLGFIEDMGGMNPIDRAQENGPFGVGA